MEWSLYDGCFSCTCRRAVNVRKKDAFLHAVVSMVSIESAVGAWTSECMHLDQWSLPSLVEDLEPVTMCITRIAFTLECKIIHRFGKHALK